MNLIHYPVQKLTALFQQQTVATLPELKSALGTPVDVTVFRKLSALPYRTSYSHRGAFYTLESLMQFDAQGLWSHRNIHFSRHGTLLETAAVLVEESPAGYRASELSGVLQVEVKDALRQLVQAGRLFRREWDGFFWYGAAARARRQEQWAAWQAQGQGSDQVQAALMLFYSLLDEQQRRLYAGLESLQWGHGGDRRMAQMLGLDVATVARGRQQLLALEFGHSG